jgi:hypothetical protein
MAFGKHRMVEFDYEPGHKYPYVCVAWREVGGMNVGDRFTDEVGEALIDYLKDEIKIVVNKPQETVDD